MNERRFGKFGLMLWPSDRISTLSTAVREAVSRYNFGVVTICDDFLYENMFVCLAKIAQDHGVPIGTLIAHPYGRNPLQLATALASLSELSKTGKVLAGIGSGGALQDRLVKRLNKQVGILSETAVLLRTLFEGKEADLAEFPTLSSLYPFKTACARLELPPPQTIPIYIAAGGPNMARVAGEVGNGVIFSDASPIACVYGMKKGLLDKAMQHLEEGRSRSRVPGAFEKIWLLTISIDEDEKKAVQQAKRSLSYKFAGYWYHMEVFKNAVGTMEDLDLSAESKRAINAMMKAYHRDATSVTEAASLVPDELVYQGLFTIAGTPEQCREQYRAALEVAAKFDFSTYIIGLVEGSDQVKSLRLIAEKVLPFV